MNRYRDDVTCRSCGEPPAKRRDQISEKAVAYTCSTCLGAVPRNPQDGQGQGVATPASGKPLRSHASEKGFSGTSLRGGRPRLDSAERLRRQRDRKRRWREQRGRA